MIESYEDRVLAGVRNRVFNGGYTIVFQQVPIQVHAVYLESQPSVAARLMIIFRIPQFPHCIFGYCTSPSPIQIFNPDGTTRTDEHPEGLAMIIHANFIEQIMAKDLGFPPDCADTGITWIGMRP